MQWRGLGYSVRTSGLQNWISQGQKSLYLHFGSFHLNGNKTIHYGVDSIFTQFLKFTDIIITSYFFPLKNLLLTLY